MSSTRKRAGKDRDDRQRTPRQLLTPDPEPIGAVPDHQNGDIQFQASDTLPASHEPLMGGTSEDRNVIPDIHLNDTPAQTPNVDSDGDIGMNDITIDDWIIDLINTKESETGGLLDMTSTVLSNGQDLEMYAPYFDKINEEIREECIKRDISAPYPLIASRAYEDALRSLIENLASYKANGVSRTDEPAIRDHCEQVHGRIRDLGDDIELPASWNIDITRIIETLKGAKPRRKNKRNPTAMPDLDVDDLDALESRTRKDQHQFSSCEVLHWWPKGTGTQTFVQYGDKSAPVYRIRAGSYEPYDKASVPRLWTTSSRGTMKEIIHTGDGEDEVWKYTRSDVKRIIAVGWKVPDDDDSGMDALALIKPERGATYPQTKALVLWKDGQNTLEGRSFIRRIANGPGFRGDEMIYQKAKELETAYEERNGPLQGAVDSQETESEDSGSDRDPNFSDHEVSSKARKNKSRSRNRNEKPRTRRGSAKKDEIQRLERELERLKAGGRTSHSKRR